MAGPTGRPTASVASACAARPLDRAAADRDDVLRLMGRGYELLDRPRDAADCFAGRTPAR